MADLHDRVPEDPLGLTLGQRLQSALDERIKRLPVGEQPPDVPVQERTLKNRMKHNRHIS